MSKAVHLIAILVLIGFVLIASVLVMQMGVCCADDGSFALLAKNLAWGYGYASSIGYHSSTFSLKLFDSTIQTTGPTLILPTAFAIWLFGNQYWIPGATQILVWLTLFFAIYRTLCSVTEPNRVSAAAAVFLVLVYAVSPYHFEQWWALFGEVPSILLVILGFSWWAVDPCSNRHLFWASMFIGLAVMTKLLSLIYMTAFVLSVFIWNLSSGRTDKVRRALADVFWVGCVCLIPFICFEAWKLIKLGFAGYVDNILQFLAYARGQGMSNKLFDFGQLTERTQNFYSRFGVSISEMLLLGGASVYFSFQTGSNWLRRLTTVSFSGAVIHSLYWLIFSLGWPRYFYSGLVLLCFIVSISFLAIDKREGRILYFLILAVLLTGTLGRIGYPLIMISNGWFTTAPDRKNQVLVTEFLDVHFDQRPFVSFWGGSVTDLEYLLRGVANFTGYKGLKPQDFERGFLLVRNAKFDKHGGAEDQQFKSLVSNCGLPVLIAEPYTVYDCKPKEDH